MKKRPKLSAKRKKLLESIEYAKIHPSIGIARVGDSPDEYVLGPELVGQSFRNSIRSSGKTGAIKRQGVRFRVYGYKQEDGKEVVVTELTANDAVINWQVRVANQKAAWYVDGTSPSYMPFDLPGADQIILNKRFPHQPASALIIDSGLNSIEGVNASKALSKGKILETDVDLGDIKTDQEGRLIFLGGHGVSDTIPPHSTDVNSVRFDDVSDGPVTARVKIGQRSIPCAPAWVVTTPPKFAPELQTVRTLYDLLTQVAIDGKLLVKPDDDRFVSFNDEVLPILERLTNLQWVSDIFRTRFGEGAEFNFLEPALLTKLRTPGSPGNDPNADCRKTIFANFQLPKPKVNDIDKWPPLYGDVDPADKSELPMWSVSLTEQQWITLKLWSEGKFKRNGNHTNKRRRTIEDLPVAEQPSMLDRASLSYALADALHPGPELGWVIRIPSIYSEAYRIKHQPLDCGFGPYPEKLTQDYVMSASGPIHAQGPGDLTRWLALPWQSELNACSTGSKGNAYGNWWPAGIPRSILTMADYKDSKDSTVDPETRKTKLHNLSDWITGDVPYKNWPEFRHFGIVSKKPGPKEPGFPRWIFVSDRGTFDQTNGGTTEPKAKY